MFKDNTLFILGAGASLELGFPSGAQLSKDILEVFQSPGLTHLGGTAMPGILDQLNRDRVGDGDREQLRHTKNKLVEALPHADSIDQLIELHNDDELLSVLAKYAISGLISHYEKTSPLSDNELTIGGNAHNFDPTLLEKTYLARIFDIAKVSVGRRELDQLFSGIEVINFNYDRSFEIGLALMVRRFYAIDPADAIRLVSGVSMVRPYGWLGPVSSEPTGVAAVPYGRELSSDTFRAAVSNIRTYSELPDSGTMSSVRDAIARAQRIVFLGFAFHRQNMQLLETQSSVHKTIYGTRYGIAEPNWIEIEKELTELFSTTAIAGLQAAQEPDVALSEITCEANQHLAEHARVFMR